MRLPVKSLILPICLILIGAGSILWCLYDHNKYQDSYSWSEARGKLTDFGNLGSNNLKYEYRVNGKKYISHRLTYYAQHNLPTLNTIFKQTDLDSDDFLTVFYNPNDPSESILVKGHLAISKDYIYTPQIIFGLIFLLLGSYFTRRAFLRSQFFDAQMT